MNSYMPYTPHFATPQYPDYRSNLSKLSDNIMIDSKGIHKNPDITLLMRQEPKEALVLTEGKEKGRKPLDPPPVVQLQVNDRVEASHHFLQSPYLFMVVNLWKADKDEPWFERGGRLLYGGLCSSLHRLKDVNNKDGGFFVFGDISIKTLGSFRLQFSLFDLQKDPSEAAYLGSVVSQTFKVVPPKDFKGLGESTYLSRAFSDQGVKLRLHKEPRTFTGQKRPYYPEGSSAELNTPLRSNDSYYDDDAAQPHKRFRADTEDRKETYTSTPQTSFPTSSYTSTPQASYSSSYPSSYPPSYTSLPQANYLPQYSSSPYQVTAPYAGQYSGSNIANMSQSTIPQPDMSQSSIPQPDMSHSNIPHSSMQHSSIPHSMQHSNIPNSSMQQSSMSQYPEIDAWNPSWRNHATSDP